MEGSVPPTSGFGDRRSPLSYTRIYTALKDGTLRVGSGFPGACLWASPKLYDHGFTAGALFFPDGYSYSLPFLPHGGCDPPARIVGWLCRAAYSVIAIYAYSQMYPLYVLIFFLAAFVILELSKPFSLAALAAEG